MATAEEARPGRAGGTDHEYSSIQEPVGPHTVVPFKQRLLEPAFYDCTMADLHSRLISYDYYLKVSP